MTTKPTRKPVKKAAAFGYGEPLIKKAASASAPDLKTALAKIGVASTLKKVIR